MAMFLQRPAQTLSRLLIMLFLLINPLPHLEVLAAVAVCDFPDVFVHFTFTKTANPSTSSMTTKAKEWRR